MFQGRRDGILIKGQLRKGGNWESWRRGDYMESSE